MWWIVTFYFKEMREKFKQQYGSSWMKEKPLKLGNEVIARTSAIQLGSKQHNWSSIQYRHLLAPTYKLSRWRARRTKINVINVTQVGNIRKQVRFLFNFETVQRKCRVTKTVLKNKNQKIQNAQLNKRVLCSFLEDEAVNWPDDKTCVVHGAMNSFWIRPFFHGIKLGG